MSHPLVDFAGQSRWRLEALLLNWCAGGPDPTLCAWLRLAELEGLERRTSATLRPSRPLDVRLDCIIHPLPGMRLPLRPGASPGQESLPHPPRVRYTAPGGWEGFGQERVAHGLPTPRHPVGPGDCAPGHRHRCPGSHLPCLNAVSHRCGLPYARGTVRVARRRWGSCSRAGTISLNARLLLLAAPLVDYVCVHELCHTREPNHSSAFWRLVARHCPAYAAARTALRAAGKQLPAWVLDPGEDLRP